MVTSGASLSAHRGAGYKKPPSVSSILPPSSYFPSQSLVGDRYRKHRFANTQVPCALGFVSPIALDLVKTYPVTVLSNGYSLLLELVL